MKHLNIMSIYTAVVITLVMAYLGYADYVAIPLISGLILFILLPEHRPTNGPIIRGGIIDGIDVTPLGEPSGRYVTDIKALMGLYNVKGDKVKTLCFSRASYIVRHWHKQQQVKRTNPIVVWCTKRWYKFKRFMNETLVFKTKKLS